MKCQVQRQRMKDAERPATDIPDAHRNEYQRRDGKNDTVHAPIVRHVGRTGKGDRLAAKTEICDRWWMNMWALAARVVVRLAWPVRPGAFRLWLALLVFIHHLSSLDWGPAAVYAFFVLSGFWIETMWAARYRHARRPYLTYLVSRVWRLAPAMVLVSVITIVLLPVIGVPATVIWAAPLHLIASTAFLLGYAWLPYLPVGSAWSLDVEMQFYLVAPMLALALAGTGAAAAAGPDRGRPGRAGPAVLVVAASVCSAWSALVIKAYVLPCYIAFFMVGMTASRLAWQPSRRLAGRSIAGTAALALGDIVSPWRGILVGGAHPGPLHVYAPAFNVALAVTIIPFAIADHPPDQRPARSRHGRDVVYRLSPALAGHAVVLRHHRPVPAAAGGGGDRHRPGAAGILADLALLRSSDQSPARARWVAARMVDDRATADRGRQDRAR